MLIKIRSISEISYDDDKDCNIECDIELLILREINDKLITFNYVVNDVQLTIPKTLGNVKINDLLGVSMDYDDNSTYTVEKIYEDGFEEKISKALETISTKEKEKE